MNLQGMYTAAGAARNQISIFLGQNPRHFPNFVDTEYQTYFENKSDMEKSENWQIFIASGVYVRWYSDIQKPKQPTELQ